MQDRPWGKQASTAAPTRDATADVLSNEAQALRLRVAELEDRQETVARWLDHAADGLLVGRWHVSKERGFVAGMLDQAAALLRGTGPLPEPPEASK